MLFWNTRTMVTETAVLELGPTIILFVSGEYFITAIVQKCWHMVIIKADWVFIGFANVLNILYRQPTHLCIWSWPLPSVPGSSNNEYSLLDPYWNEVVSNYSITYVFHNCYINNPLPRKWSFFISNLLFLNQKWTLNILK